MPAPSAPRSASIRIVSSRKSGLPSALSSTSVLCAAGSLPSGSSPSASCALSSSLSRASSIAVARRLPPPHAGRSSSSSGRLTQAISSGTSRSDCARCSITFNSGSSAQWMSSKTSTSGCIPESCSAHARAAQRSSSRERSRSLAPSRPAAVASRSAIASLSQHARSLSNASATGSSSVIPADCFTISASAQYVTPSPNGRQRPRRIVARSMPSTNSCTSRLLPIPGSPKTVARCARRSRVAREYALRRSSSSSSRPTNGAERTGRAD